MGDFSRATHLSVKTLRHYHQVGLLQPATVNPDTGYRYYSAHQIATAQVIRAILEAAEHAKAAAEGQSPATAEPGGHGSDRQAA